MTDGNSNRFGTNATARLTWTHLETIYLDSWVLSVGIPNYVMTDTSFRSSENSLQHFAFPTSRPWQADNRWQLAASRRSNRAIYLRTRRRNVLLYFRTTGIFWTVHTSSYLSFWYRDTQSDENVPDQRDATARTAISSRIQHISPSASKFQRDILLKHFNLSINKATWLSWRRLGFYADRPQFDDSLKVESTKMYDRNGGIKFNTMYLYITV